MGDNEKRRFTQLRFLTQKQPRWFASWICCTVVAIFVVISICLAVFNHEPDPDPIQFFGEEQFIDPTPTQPAVKLLDSEPKIGEIIHIYANITNSTTSSNDFCIALVKDDQKNVPMKICVQFGNVSRILYTAIWDGQLKGNHSGPNPFTPGDKLDLRIRFLDQYIQIFPAQGEAGIFEKIPQVHTAKTLSIQGGVTGIRLITKDGQKYSNPMGTSLVLNYTTRMDLMARPLAKFENGLWNDLIEGTNGTKPTHLRVKRKGGGGHGSGGGRGGSAARGGGRGGGGHSGHSSFHGGSFHSTSSYHYHYSYSSSSCCYYGGGGGHASSHPARAKWGSYQYSPVFGGYYQLPSFNLSTANNSHIFTPSSYSYRLDNGTFYVPSYGHGKALSNDSVIDHSKIPRPKRFDILFSKDNIDPTFTLSFRYTEETVVLNTWAGVWDAEERSPFMPIDDWRIFDLTIINQHDGLHIYINRYPFVTFTHKSNLTDSLKYVRIDGDIEVLSLTVDGL